MGFDSGANLSVNFNETIGGLSGTSGTATVASGKMLTINTASNYTFGGSITGDGALGKTGTGTEILTGANTYGGGTTISQGTLVFGSNSSSGSGTVTLNGGQLGIASGVTLSNNLNFGAGGGTLRGNGTIGSPITVGSNVVLSPGNSPGTLTFTSASGLTLAGGGQYDWQIESVTGAPGASWDLISVTGGPLNITATSGSPFAINVLSLDGSGNAGAVVDFNSSTNYSWVVATAPNGIFNFSPDEFSINTAGFQNSLDGGSFFVTADATDLMLNFTPVPEPSTYALMGLGLGVMLVGLRRRSRRVSVST